MIEPEQNKVVPISRRVRAVLGGRVIADSKRVLLARTRPPTYYFPPEDVDGTLLLPSDTTGRSPQIGPLGYWHLDGSPRPHDAVWSPSQPPPEFAAVRGYLALAWHAVDGWFEEEDEVFVHPRDPFTRLDVLHSSRHLEVIAGGQVVAESAQPILLLETGLPVRCYVPKLHTRFQWMIPSVTVSRCPYKGEAQYYSLRLEGRVWKDVAWYYSYPNVEVAAIATRVCFYQERVDAILLDGEPI